MADPLSIAASAIAVAGAGFKLADTLYGFLDNFRKAERHLRPIAQHVKHTSVILENVGLLLRTDEIQSLCQARLLKSTEQELNGCQGAFRELEDYLKGLMKLKKDGSHGLTTWDKATWSYRQKEIDVLQAHLERFKSSLELVFSVLNVISSTRNHQKSSAEIDGLKAQISMLIKALEVAKAKDDAASRQRQEVSVPDPFMAIGTFIVLPTRPAESTAGGSAGNTKAEQKGSLDPGDVPTRPGARDLIADETSGAAMLAPETVDHGPTQDDRDAGISSEILGDQAQSQGNDELLLHLSKCAEAVASLASSIQAATKLWQTQKQYERDCIAKRFAVAQQSVKRLRYFEACFEPPSKRQRVAATAAPEVPTSKSYRSGLPSNEDTALQLFDEHAAACWICGNAYKRYQRGEKICSKGMPLADDVCSLVRYDGNGVYVALQRGEAPVLIHMPAQFPFAVDLLEAVAYHGKPPEPINTQKRDCMQIDYPDNRSGIHEPYRPGRSGRLHDEMRIDAMRIDPPSTRVENSNSMEGWVVTEGGRSGSRTARSNNLPFTRDSYQRERPPPAASDTRDARRRRRDDTAFGNINPGVGATKEEPQRAEDFSAVDELLRSWTLLDV